jgi:tetratricopeptide (TPR) repeat protein
LSEKKELPIVGADPSGDPEAALARLRAGDSATVIAALRAELERAPDDDQAWRRLGVAYLGIEHWAEAAGALERAVALDDAPETRRLLARALGRLDRLDAAVFQLLQAKRRAPRDPRVAHELGVAFYDKRLYDKAVHELERARALVPLDARVAYALGLAHEARGDAAAALTSYRAAVRLDPGFAEARKTLADTLASLGELAEAAAELAEVQRLERTSTRVAQNLEALEHALAELRARRLLGKTEREVEASALVRKGRLARLGPVAGRAELVRYGAALTELWLTLDPSGAIVRLLLVLPDAERAARAPDDAFGVTVLAQDGRERAADHATAATLTFLREALGCTLTRAGELYARLLAARSLEWSGARLGFDAVEIAGRTHHGLYVEPV